MLLVRDMELTLACDYMDMCRLIDCYRVLVSMLTEKLKAPVPFLNRLLELLPSDP